MRISDWSSDVCSSDLEDHAGGVVDLVVLQAGAEQPGGVGQAGRPLAHRARAQPRDRDRQHVRGAGGGGAGGEGAVLVAGGGGAGETVRRRLELVADPLVAGARLAGALLAGGQGWGLWERIRGGK